MVQPARSIERHELPGSMVCGLERSVTNWSLAGTALAECCRAWLKVTDQLVVAHIISCSLPTTGSVPFIDTSVLHCRKILLRFNHPPLHVIIAEQLAAACGIR